MVRGEPKRGMSSGKGLAFTGKPWRGEAPVELAAADLLQAWAAGKSSLPENSDGQDMLKVVKHWQIAFTKCHAPRSDALPLLLHNQAVAYWS